MSLRIDDSTKPLRKTVFSENKHGTFLANGKTERELLREYRAKYGEERYKKLKKEIAETKEREKLAQK